MPYCSFHTKATSKKSRPPSLKLPFNTSRTSENRDHFQARGWPETVLEILSQCLRQLQLRLHGDSQHESGRFARITSRESLCRKTLTKRLFFITFEQFARIASNLLFAIFCPEVRFAERVPFGNPQAIRANRAI